MRIKRRIVPPEDPPVPPPPSALPVPPAPADAAELIRSRVARDQLTMLFELSPQPVLAGGAFSVLLGVVLWPTLGGATLVAWMAARVAVTLARVWDCRNFLARSVPAQALPARRLRFIALMALECAGWSVLGLAFVAAVPPQTGLVLLATMVTVAAVSIFSLGSDFRAGGLFVAIVLLPNALAQFGLGTPESLVTGGGMLILFVLLLLEARGLEQRMSELLRLRHENGLIAEQRQRALLLAEHSSRAKSRFLATVSHEMRTPLNGILGMTQLLQQEVAEEPQLARLRVVAQSARHLQSVIGDLLDLSRIESNRLTVQAAPVRLQDMLRDVIDLLTPGATQKGLRFDVDVEPGLPEWTLADAVRVKQVLHNLLGNAIKFTSAGGVALHLARIGDELVFSVRDTGVGVPPAERERIFQAFEQVAAPGAQDYRAGTGLGLTISRELARAMGGDVTCQPASGQGSEFRFTLPCRPCAALAEAAAPPAAAEAPHLAGRVLLAEDSPVNVIIARAMLERMGLSVDVAADGQAALDGMRSGGYVAVLMDCQMPVLDGWQATRRWREHEADQGLPRLPIIALTANAVVGDRERCLEAGMDDYLPKPFEVGELAALMRRHVAAG